MVYFRDSQRPSYISAECASCILDVSTKYFKLALAQDPSVSYSEEMLGIHTLIQQLDKDFCPESSPQEIAQNSFLLAAKLVGIDDPWKGIRDLSNQIALDLIPEAQRTLDLIADPKQRLYEAICWSITGNTLDFGTAGHDVQLDSSWLLQAHSEFKNQGFYINDFEDLWTLLQEYCSVLYICDNAGEIAFDMLVISELIHLGFDVTAVVKGGPISNDAIYDDALQIGLPDVCPVITTGSADLGFFPEHNSVEFLETLHNAPLIIAKGQANWECIYAYQDMLSSNLFILLK